MRDTDPSVREWLERLRWPSGPVCAHCQSNGSVYAIRGRPGSTTRPGVWKCGRCRKQFTVTVDTVLEEARIPLAVWLRAVWLYCQAGGRMTAREMAGAGVSVKTGRALLGKIRYALRERGRDNPILEKGQPAGDRPPFAYEAVVSDLLAVPPARKHPDAMARRLAELSSRAGERKAPGGKYR